MSNYKFYETLFPETDSICMGRTIYDTKITGASIDPAYQFFSINSLSGPRKDANVSNYRNILIEFDTGSIPEQIATLTASRIPYTSLCFSGSKSIHCIISLESPLANEFEYRSLVERIYAKIPGIDKACGNPSRFSRAPGGNRNGVEQSLIELHQRIPNKLLLDWLGPASIAPLIEPRAYSASTGHLSGYTLNFLAFGAPAGTWNQSLFNAVCDMTRQGMQYEQIMGKCESITGYLDSRDKSTIKSAFNRATKDAK